MNNPDNGDCPYKYHSLPSSRLLSLSPFQWLASGKLHQSQVCIFSVREELEIFSKPVKLEK